MSTTKPWHQSALVGASVHSPLVPTLRLDAAADVLETVSRLNDFQPESLVAYASTAEVLAHEQLNGRLAIAPKAVFCASEVVISSARAVITKAFGVQPFETYAATETAGIASDCRDRHLHIYEDLVIPELVDMEGRPVPAGQFGDRLLVTVLFSRTLPLIRYELTDRVALRADPYPCDLPFRALAAVEGRTEDVLRLPATSGVTSVGVHPNVFHDVLDRAAVSGWQVVQHTADRIQVRVVPASGLDQLLCTDPSRLPSGMRGQAPSWM